MNQFAAGLMVGGNWYQWRIIFHGQTGNWYGGRFTDIGNTTINVRFHCSSEHIIDSLHRYFLACFRFPVPLRRHLLYTRTYVVSHTR